MTINETTTTTVEQQSNNVAIIAGVRAFDSIMDDEDGVDDLMTGVISNDSTAAAVLVKYYGKLMHHPVLNSFNISREYIESTLEPGTDGDQDDVSMASTVSTIVIMCKALIIGFIILAAIFGNMLVIVSVMQHRRLR